MNKLFLSALVSAITAFSSISFSGEVIQAKLPDAATTSKEVVNWVKDNNKFGVDSGVVQQVSKEINSALPNIDNLFFAFGSGLMKSGLAHMLYVRGGQVLTLELTEQQLAHYKIDPNTYSLINLGSKIYDLRYDPPLVKLSSPSIKNAMALDDKQPIEGDVEVEIKTKFPQEVFLRLYYKTFKGSVSENFFPEKKLEIGTTKLHFSFRGLNQDGIANEDTQPYKVKSLPLVFFLDVCTYQNQVYEIFSNTLPIIVEMKK